MTRAISSLLLLLLPATAFAHTEKALAGGFASGFLHPLQGGDHLLAMIAVGIWGAVLGAPLLWLLPVTFPLLMVIGAVSALLGVTLPAIEPGIAFSVVVLGGAIAAFWRAPVAVAMAIVAFFGFLHGYAHGNELPEAAHPAAYATGFVLASGLLHAAGIAIGALRSVRRGDVALSVAGALIAITGLWLLVRGA